MSGQKKWDELYEEASRKVLHWRRKHKKATLTEREDTVCGKSDSVSRRSSLANWSDGAVFSLRGGMGFGGSGGACLSRSNNVSSRVAE